MIVSGIKQLNAWIQFLAGKKKSVHLKEKLVFFFCPTSKIPSVLNLDTSSNFGLDTAKSGTREKRTQLLGIKKEVKQRHTWVSF